jgi:hypothetical protein
VTLPGFAPQQEGIGLIYFLKKGCTHIVMPVRHSPTTILKSTFCIFFGAARRLHYAIE